MALYAPYDGTRIAGSIGELLSRAPGAQALASGLGSIGQAIADVPRIQAQQRAAAQSARMTDVQIGEAERKAKLEQTREKLGAALNAATVLKDGHVTFDLAAFKAAGDADPDLAPHINEPLMAMGQANDAFTAYQAGKFKTSQEALTDIFGRAALTGGTADDVALIAAPFVNAKVISAEDVRPMLTRLASVPDAPSRVKLLRGAAGIKAPNPVSVAPGGSLVNPEDPSKALYTAPDPEAEARAADRKADNDRADKQFAHTVAHDTAMLGVAQENAATSRMNAETTRNRYTASGIDTSMDPKFSTALERAVLSVPAARRPAVATLANRLWSEGNTNELKDVIRQAAIDSENVDTKNLVLGRSATRASLADTRQILKEMKDAGVPSGYFTGTVEDLARKVGKTTDPRYVALANRLMGTLINYRRAATGVSFGEREGADYARMFPNYKNDLPVNLALIDGLEREMTTYDRAYWEHKLGKDGAALVGVLQAQKVPGETPEQRAKRLYDEASK